MSCPCAVGSADRRTQLETGVIDALTAFRCQYVLGNMLRKHCYAIERYMISVEFVRVADKIAWLPISLGREHGHAHEGRQSQKWPT